MALNTQTAKQQWLDEAGIDIFQLISPNGGAVVVSMNSEGGTQVDPQVLPATGPLNGSLPGLYVITATSAATITVSAPVVTVDDGLEIQISSNTNFAHVIVVGTGRLQLGQTAGAQVTFPAFAGATIFLTAYQGKWIVATGGGTGTYLVA